MKFYFQIIIFSFLCITVIYAQDTKVDILLEKVQQSKSKEEKQVFLSKLKIELAKINKKARDESNAIIEAKKKIPLKLFNDGSVKK